MAKTDWLGDWFGEPRGPRKPPPPRKENNPPRITRPEMTDRVIEANLTQILVGGENGNC